MKSSRLASVMLRFVRKGGMPFFQQFAACSMRIHSANGNQTIDNHFTPKWFRDKKYIQIFHLFQINRSVVYFSILIHGKQGNIIEVSYLFILEWIEKLQALSWVTCYIRLTGSVLKKCFFLKSDNSAIFTDIKVF